MSADWVACGVRARAMQRRCLGRDGARTIATAAGPVAALAILAGGPYGGALPAGATIPDAQRAVVTATVWNLRVLAGWAPRSGVSILRALVAVVEIRNVREHLARLAGGPELPPVPLGALATAWPLVEASTTPAELRQALARSPWGDPGGTGAREVVLGMRTALADRILAVVPAASGWAATATALLVAREQVAGGSPLPQPARDAAARVLGPSALSATTLPGLAAALPRAARPAFEPTAPAADLWLAEARWWARLEEEGRALTRRPPQGSDAVVGTAALLAVDAWRVRAALEVAARNGAGLEVLDAVA